MTQSKHPGAAGDTLESTLHEADLYEVEGSLRVGDLVFTRIPGSPFRQIADATGTWTNHVGIVVGFGRTGAIVAESRVPLSCRTRFARFVRRSCHQRVAVLRLPRALSQVEVERLHRAARRRLGRFYDTGFDLGSRRQFCSRFVREVLQEAIHQNLGDVETFAELLAHNPAVGPAAVETVVCRQDSLEAHDGDAGEPVPEPRARNCVRWHRSPPLRFPPQTFLKRGGAVALSLPGNTQPALRRFSGPLRNPQAMSGRKPRAAGYLAC